MSSLLKLIPFISSCLRRSSTYHQSRLIVHSTILQQTLERYLQVSCVYHSTTGAIFQWTNLCCLGGTRTPHPSLDFHSQCSTNWTTRPPFVWRLIASPPHSTTLDYHGLPLWISKPRTSAIISLNPCKIYLNLGMCWIMMTVSILSTVSTSYLVLDSK